MNVLIISNSIWYFAIFRQKCVPLSPEFYINFDKSSNNKSFEIIKRNRRLSGAKPVRVKTDNRFTRIQHTKSDVKWKLNLLLYIFRVRGCQTLSRYLYLSMANTRRFIYIYLVCYILVVFAYLFRKSLWQLTFIGVNCSQID